MADTLRTDGWRRDLSVLNEIRPRWSHGYRALAALEVFEISRPQIVDLDGRFDRDEFWVRSGGRHDDDRRMPTLKIATFNINNIARRLAVLLQWLTKVSPDIVCLQEIKAPDAKFPLRQMEAAGYGARWVGQPSWNGVAILAKGMTPVETRRQLPGDPSDTQSRYLEAAAHGVLVGCLYAPNGNPQPGPKFAYKLAWMHRLLAHAQALYDTGHPVALVGDYNVVPTDFDIYNTRSWRKNALLQPEPRALYQRLLGQGWTDAIKATHPDEPVYTFWDYLRQAWERNAGMRLDHILLSASLSPRLRATGVDAWVRGLAGASDHAPAWANIETDPPSPRRKKRRST